MIIYAGPRMGWGGGFSHVWGRLKNGPSDSVLFLTLCVAIKFFAFVFSLNGCHFRV